MAVHTHLCVFLCVDKVQKLGVRSPRVWSRGLVHKMLHHTFYTLYWIAASTQIYTQSLLPAQSVLGALVSFYEYGEQGIDTKNARILRKRKQA